MANQNMTVVWVDAAGQNQLRSIASVAGASGILAALEGKSNAGVVETWEGDQLFPAVMPTAANYLPVTQVAYLMFTDGAGHNARLSLPAPDASIFASDGVSVDASQITAIISACIGSLLTGAGTAVTAFVSGTLGPGPVSGG